MELKHIAKIEGMVLGGKQIGRKLGFPTANIAYNNATNLIKDGVYIAVIELKETGNSYPCIVNKGKHPTFPEGDKTIEAYILFENIDLYNKHIVIHFYKKLRDEIKFDRKEDLIKQIDSDLIQSIAWFKKNSNFKIQ